MSSKKDMRREDLIVPFVEPEGEKSENMSGTLSQTMPMAALFTRNKMIGWVSLIFTLQTWLAESPAKRKSSAAGPGYLNVGLALMALAVSYLPLFLPPAAGGYQSPSGTQAVPPPQS